MEASSIARTADTTPVMKVEDWVARYEKKDTPWQKPTSPEEVTTTLGYFSGISELQQTEKRGSKRILLPLCGKAPDLLFFFQQGLQVIGIDGVEQSVLEWISENSIKQYTVTILDHNIKRYDFLDKMISVYIGDIFNPELLQVLPSPIDYLYDRNALVAVHPSQRQVYVDTIVQFIKRDRHLIQRQQNNPGYDILQQSYWQDMDLVGTPWRISLEEVCQLYQAHVDPSSSKVVYQVQLTKQTPNLTYQRSTAVTAFKLA